MILIGSRALSLRAPSALHGRRPVDFDFVCTKAEFDAWCEKNKEKVHAKKIYSVKDETKWIVEGDSNCEFDMIQPGNSNDLMDKLVRQDCIETPFGMVPNLDMLFTIKSSHKYLKNSPHFWKTVQDYHVLRRAGCTVRPEYQEFFSLREKETYTYSHPKLNVNKDSFFKDDSIDYKWEHDTIHQSVAIFERPAYTYYMKDGEQVQCDEEKFLTLPEKYRLAGVVEEAAVLAIERSLVPHPGVWSPKFAWKFALSKVCSSITSGWFRAFAYENIIEVLKLYPEGYWDKFQKDCESGLVKPFTGSRY